jgi:hypothetical protein
MSLKFLNHSFSMHLFESYRELVQLLRWKGQLLLFTLLLHRFGSLVQLTGHGLSDVIVSRQYNARESDGSFDLNLCIMLQPVLILNPLPK